MNASDAQAAFLTRWGRFGVLWSAQTISVTARAFTTFALGVWIFEKTRSATLYTLLPVAALLPGLLMAPVLGVLTDRLGPKRSLLLADGVPRAAALMQLGYAGQGVVAPVLGGLMLGGLGAGGLICLDVLTTVLAFGAVMSMPRSAPKLSPSGGIWDEFVSALQMIRDRGLMPLAGYIIATYFPGGWVLALATPLVLTISGPKTLGIVLSVMGLGMVVGSVMASAFTRPERGVRRLLSYDALLVLAMLSAGFASTPRSIALLGFVFLLGLGGMMAEEQAIWQLRIPLEAQGRVFSIRRVLTWASLPLSYGLSGPLADHVFEPAMASGRPLADWIGPWIGTGPGRGIALLLMCGGVVKGAVLLWGCFNRKLRALDHPLSGRTFRSAASS